MQPLRPCLALVPACLFFCAPTGSASPQDANEAIAPKSAAIPTDEELLEVWKKLPPEDREEIIAWFSAEASHLGTYQSIVIKYVLDHQEFDPYIWPLADRPVSFNPKTHAPGQPIPRKWIAEEGARAKRWREEIFKASPARKFESGWLYDYATQELRRTHPIDDPERIFRNALAGFPPQLGLVEALVEQALDDGSQKKTLMAFGHAYSDRAGRVYPGVTLYDAWASGLEIEMPDVDTLGIVHTLLDDWKTWVAPVPASQHDALYKTIGEIFVDARHYRGLRLALARTYATGSPTLRDGYGPNLVRFHALWEKMGATPERMAQGLPSGPDWQDWMEQLVKDVDGDLELWRAGEVRRTTLDADAQRVRTALIWVLREFGAL